MLNSEEKINIIPIIARDFADDLSIIKQFDEISFSKNTQGEFSISFFVNALISEKYNIKYLIVKKVNNNYKILHLADFIIPPTSAEFKTKSVDYEWSFCKNNIINGISNIRVSYSMVSETGEYGILAFYKQIDEDENTENIKLSDMELACEKHFWVRITD